MDFFKPSCQEPPINIPLFGIRDGINGEKAFIDKNNPQKWIATVKNENERKVIFTAIDKCIIKDNEYPGRGRCDGMLNTANQIYFVELKNESSHWKKKAVEQLESTIIFFLENHKVGEFQHKKAFVCNRKHKPFKQVNNELNQRFFHLYRFRIDIQAEIIIK